MKTTGPQLTHGNAVPKEELDYMSPYETSTPSVIDDESPADNFIVSAQKESLNGDRTLKVWSDSTVISIFKKDAKASCENHRRSPVYGVCRSLVHNTELPVARLPCPPLCKQRTVITSGSNKPVIDAGAAEIMQTQNLRMKKVDQRLKDGVQLCAPIFLESPVTDPRLAPKFLTEKTSALFHHQIPGCLGRRDLNCLIGVNYCCESKSFSRLVVESYGVNMEPLRHPAASLPALAEASELSGGCASEQIWPGMLKRSSHMVGILKYSEALRSVVTTTVVAQDPDIQSLKPDHSEPESPSYTQLATLIAGDSDVHMSAKEKRLQPNKPYTIRQIRKLLAGFKVQSSEKTSLVGAPPKELLGAAIQRSKPPKETFPIKPRQNVQETKQTQIRLNSLNNSKSGRPKGVIERATSSSGRNFRPWGKTFVRQRQMPAQTGHLELDASRPLTETLA
ncbi:hypothetical protein CLF_100345 [Clonorchis sinensis]|uniref:Uncharacterized protein n=1 Tax=Clonorchis sinensis TaxID=79923 RepID=G7Y391_CLOSI|nr:hypothetical protein CLF_100345 [Clonorchis sinensis]